MFRERYELLERIGSGSFGDVHAAKDIQSGKVYAVKRVVCTEHESSAAVLPRYIMHEVEALRQLTHPNIIELIDVLPDGSAVALVMERLDTDLHRLVKLAREPLPESDVRGLLRMLLQGIAHCHDQKIMHRDLKPANLLLSRNARLKIADFGLATVLCKHECKRSYSPQVATRWYRAPEILFGSKDYDSAVDVWSAGAIFAELLTLVPIFPGQSDLDQIYRIIQVLGSSSEECLDMKYFPDWSKITLPAYKSIHFSLLMPNASFEALDLLSKLLVLNPSERLSARAALAHPFFVDGPYTSLYLALLPNREAEYAAADR